MSFFKSRREKVQLELERLKKQENEKMAMAQLSAQQYQQALAQSGIHYQNLGAGIGSATTTAAGTGTISAQGINTGGLSGAAIYFPNPSGVHTNIAFTDATGRTWAFAVDSAYVGILTNISNVHAPNQSPIKSNIPRMLDGDFTEDEMSQAEEIIQEMSNGQSATHP